LLRRKMPGRANFEQLRDICSNFGQQLRPTDIQYPGFPAPKEMAR
jgi:hypothetical protein